MLKYLKSAIPAAVMIAGLLWAAATPSYATPAYARKEGQTCTYCHVSAGKPELNAAGTYYSSHEHSLVGYKPAE